MHATQQTNQEPSTNLTIGIPVYNGASTISNALDSLLHQDYRAFVINISDNASTDCTEQICSTFCKKHPKIKYCKQKHNLGAIKNFKYLLDNCETEYFMFAAADDLWAPSFVRKCLEFLDENPDYVQCQGLVAFSRKNIPTHIADGTYEISKERSIRAYKFLKNPSDNSRYYGIFRTEVLKRCFPEKSFIAHDWVVSVWTLKYGKHMELDDALMIRDTSDISVYEKSVIKEHTSTINRIFPGLPFSLFLFRNRIIPISIKSFKRLYHLNLFLHFALGTHRFQKLSNWYFREGQSLHKALTALLIGKKKPKPQSELPNELEIGVEYQNLVTLSGILQTSIHNKHIIKWTTELVQITIDKDVARNYENLRLEVVAPPEINKTKVKVLINSILIGKYKLKAKKTRAITTSISEMKSKNICIILEKIPNYAQKQSCAIGLGIKSIKLIR